MKVAPSPVALPCVTLNVDTASRSGWCITVTGIYVSSGQHDMLHQAERTTAACDAAVELGRANKLPVVLVYEKPFRGTSQGQWIGAWKLAWRAAGGVQSRVVGVYPSQWRARVLGGRYASAPRDVVRPVEQRTAGLIAHREVGGDEAAAICISRWATFAGEVAEKLPKPRRKGAA